MTYAFRRLYTGPYAHPTDLMTTCIVNEKLQTLLREECACNSISKRMHVQRYTKDSIVKQNVRLNDLMNIV